MQRRKNVQTIFYKIDVDYDFTLIECATAAVQGEMAKVEKRQPDPIQSICRYRHYVLLLILERNNSDLSDDKNEQIIILYRHFVAEEVEAENHCDATRTSSAEDSID